MATVDEPLGGRPASAGAGTEIGPGAIARAGSVGPEFVQESR
jgi:hypothetical protein